MIVKMQRPVTVFKMAKRIIRDPDICNGLPILEGTRITVRTILDFLAAGDSVENVLEDYPALEKVDVLECLRFAASLTNE
jgi:uncharacterized protein (DUF433 family)